MTKSGAEEPLLGGRWEASSEESSSNAAVADGSPPVPNVVSPPWSLALFCCLGLVIFLDRGMFASNGVNGRAGGCGPQAPSPDSSLGRRLRDASVPDCAPRGIQGDLGLSNFQDGLLPTSLVLGIMSSSPLFAHAAKTLPPTRVMGAGLLMWITAVLGCAASWSFPSLLLCRTLLGVSEATFVTLAPPCVKDLAPAHRVSSFLSVFCLCGPVGYALGFLYGGAVGPTLGWRAAFLMEAAVMLPLALVFLGCGEALTASRRTSTVAPAGGEAAGSPCPITVEHGLLPACHGGPPNDASATAPNCAEKPVPGQTPALEKKPVSSSTAQQPSQVENKDQDRDREGKGTSILTDWATLLRTPAFVRNILGYSAFFFMQGAYAFWIAKAVRAIYDFAQADAVLGATTVATGTLGTIVGGLILDKLGSSTYNALLFMGVCSAVCAVLAIVALLSPSIWLYLPIMTVSQLFEFSIQAPVNLVAMQTVPKELQSQALALTLISIHVLGDIPANPLVGLLLDACGDFRVTMVALTCVTFVASAIWLSGTCTATENARPGSRGSSVRVVE